MNAIVVRRGFKLFSPKKRFRDLLCSTHNDGYGYTLDTYQVLTEQSFFPAERIIFVRHMAR